MSEELWQVIQTQLALSVPLQRACVSCWYRTHTTHFPADASSSLCPACAEQTKRTRRGGPLPTFEVRCHA